jgi:hypothetical protein
MLLLYHTLLECFVFFDMRDLEDDLRWSWQLPLLERRMKCKLEQLDILVDLLFIV